MVEPPSSSSLEPGGFVLCRLLDPWSSLSRGRFGVPLYSELGTAKIRLQFCLRP
jgi:hypothetical protein